MASWSPDPDPVAARVHRRNAERHYEAAERLRRLGRVEGEQAARELAQREDSIADKLEAPPGAKTLRRLDR